MLISPYFPKDHENDLIGLLSDRGEALSVLAVLPDFGLIAYHRGIMIAAGFLRQVEGNMALLDTYVTNPESSSEDRNRALDLLTYKLLKICKDNGIREVAAFTYVPNIAIRAQAFGFKPHTGITLVRRF